MGCGCAQRREWLRAKWQQLASGLLLPTLTLPQFSIANGAPGKSGEGVWIKSTEGARGVGCNVVVDSITESTFASTSQVSISGTGFGATASTVSLNSAQDKSGTDVAQTIVSWSNTTVVIKAVQGALSPGTNYLFVDCQSVGSAIELETTGTITDWVHAYVQYNTLGFQRAVVVEHGWIGNCTGVGSQFKMVVIGNDEMLTKVGCTTLNSSRYTTLFDGCGDGGGPTAKDIATPSGHTILEYTVITGSPDVDPGEVDWEHRLKSDDSVDRRYVGSTACGDGPWGSGKTWAFNSS